jgi:hypothetical protein
MLMGPTEFERGVPLARMFAMAVRCFLTGALASTALVAFATNTPCSGRKGGVSHCAGETFVCSDGSISASKKVCDMSAGSGAGMTITSGTDCQCRNQKLCLGARGGVYCISDSGSKSYRPK